MKVSKKTLISLLATTATVDRTEPPCWRTNELLGAIEQFILVKEGNPLLFAEIAEAALKRLSDPSTRALVALAVINGRRRVQGCDVDAVQKMFESVRGEIDALPISPRRGRCQTFWQYQAGVFMARNGFYAQAAKLEAEKADGAGSPEALAVSKYLHVVYTTWEAFVDGDPGRIAEGIKALKEELLCLQKATAGTALEIQWGHGNGPIHVLQALFFADSADEGWDALMKDVLTQAAGLGLAFAPWIAVLKAENLRRQGQVAEAKKAAEAVVEGAASPDTTGAARLVLARIHRAEGATETARAIYGAVIPAPNAHMIGAVAARELAVLGGNGLVEAPY